MLGITDLEKMFHLRRNQVCTSRNWKLSQRKILSKDVGPFLKISFFSRCFSHIFAIAKQFPGFSIGRFLHLHLNVNIYMSINDYLFRYIYLVRYFKFWVYCLTCSAMSNFNSADFTTPDIHQDFNSQNRNAAWIPK